MKLQTVLSLSQSKSLAEWRTATRKAIADTKAAGHAAADALRVMRQEVVAMLNEYEPTAPRTVKD